MTRLLGGFIFSLCLLATANIEMPNPTPDWAGEFSEIITHAGMKLQDVAAKRPHKLKAMNDSVRDMARAALGMASHQPPEESEQLLESSIHHYPDNAFAYLLLAIVKNARGDPEANKLFESFLLRSRTYTEFEKPFLSWDEFHKLRRVVYALLESRGVSFKGREKEIQVRIPFVALAEYIRHPSREDKVMNVGFIAVIFGGLIGIALASLMGADFSLPFLRSLVMFYLAVWAAYGVWLFDLAFGLPGGFSRFQAVPLVLKASAGLLFLRELWHFYMRRRVRLAEGYERCPYCREVIVKLLVECPRCRRRLAR